MPPGRRPSTARLALLFGALLALLASSLWLQAHWLGQLADAQRAEARRVLATAVERMARDVHAELVRLAASFGSDSTSAARFEGWVVEVLPVASGEEPPSVVGPSLRAAPAAPGESEQLVVLDRDRLRDELFSPQVRAAFGEEAFESFRVTIVPTEGGQAPLYDTAGGAPPSGPPDASAELRFEANRWTSFFAEEGDEPQPVELPLFVSGPPGGWLESSEKAAAPYRIEVRHRAGSLEAALHQAQRRNLLIGAGILVALVASVVLLWVGEQRARRLAEKELAFVAGVSHELRTPLAVIRSASSNLRQGIVADEERVRAYGALIEREATRVGESVERVLRFGSADVAPVRERIELRGLAHEAVERASLLADRRRFTIEVEVPEGASVLGDRGALVSAVLNLLENAIKYGPDGQTIRLGVRAGDEELTLEVADQGPGLEGDERTRVFEPFFRGSAARRGNVAGSGLGLGLVAQVALAHGGRAEAAGGPGGAVFALHLPRAREAGR